MTFAQLMADLKKRKFAPVYFLHGEEAYYIDQVCDYLEDNVLNTSEKAFNFSILYGKEIDHKQVVDIARRFPMMAEYQLLIIKEAQEMRGLKDLQSYLERPSDSTILCIAHKHKKFNMNSGFGKILKKQALILESKRLYDNQIGDWIRTYLQQKKLTVQAKAGNLLAEYLGTDLSKIVNELDKLAINLPPGTELTPAHIEANIGISKDYNVFELQNALGRKDILKTNRIVQYFISNPKKNPIPMILGTLYNYFSKLYMLKFLAHSSDQDLVSALNLRSSYFLKDYKSAVHNYTRPQLENIIEVLKEYDLKSKGVNYVSTGKKDGDLLRELAWKILH